METRHLRLIKTIADEQGITKSLDKLFLTQSAVSHQLRDIEERLGTKIFYRKKNQWILTEEGKVLYRTAEIVLDEIERASERINQLRQGHEGTIRLSAECLTTYNWLPAFMVKMKVLYPRLELKMIMEASEKPLQKLLDNELDLGITTDPIQDKGIKYIELFRDEVVAVLPADHPSAQKKFLTEKDFSDETLIIYSYPIDHISVYRNFLKPKKIEPKETIAMPLTEAALEMVKAGMGILTRPKLSLAPFTLPPELKIMRISAKGLLRINYAAMRHEDAGKKSIQDFIENLKEELAK